MLSHSKSIVCTRNVSNLYDLLSFIHETSTFTNIPKFVKQYSIYIMTTQNSMLNILSTPSSKVCTFVVQVFIALTPSISKMQMCLILPNFFAQSINSHIFLCKINLCINLLVQKLIL
jgi:hypothetical protein